MCSGLSCPGLGSNTQGGSFTLHLGGLADLWRRDHVGVLVNSNSNKEGGEEGAGHQGGGQEESGEQCESSGFMSGGSWERLTEVWPVWMKKERKSKGGRGGWEEKTRLAALTLRTKTFLPPDPTPHPLSGQLSTHLYSKHLDLKMTAEMLSK